MQQVLTIQMSESCTKILLFITDRMGTITERLMSGYQRFSSSL